MDNMETLTPGKREQRLLGMFGERELVLHASAATWEIVKREAKGWLKRVDHVNTYKLTDAGREALRRADRLLRR
jgi:hypothetical protein